MLRIFKPLVVVAVMILATNLLMRIQEHCGNIKKKAKKPKSSEGFLAREYAAGKQELLYVLACQPSLSDPKKWAIPNTANACSTSARRGSTFHRPSRANDPNRSQAPPLIAPWKHLERIRFLTRCTQAR